MGSNNGGKLFKRNKWQQSEISLVWVAKRCIDKRGNRNNHDNHDDHNGLDIHDNYKNRDNC